MIRALSPYRYPSSLVGVLGQEKNGETVLEREIWSSFFLVSGKGVGKRYFLFFCLVLNVLSSCSQIHSARYSQYCSTSYLSHMVCPKFNSHVYKPKRWTPGECCCFYFAKLGGPKRCFYWGMPNVPKNLMMAQSIWLPFFFKSCGHTLIWIIMLTPAHD